MQPAALILMAFVRDVTDSIRFYRNMGFEAENTRAPQEFRVTDPDGYALMVTHT